MNHKNGFQSKYHFRCFIISFFIVVLHGFSQDIDFLVSKLDELSSRQPEESLYVQTDKGVYETEEDLWFKCYVLDSQLLLPSLRSDLVTIELINDNNNNIVWKEKYQVEKGFVNGHIFLNDSLKSGEYSLRAYTCNSINKSSKEFFAFRKIRVYKSIIEKSKDVKTKLIKNDSVINLGLFPEGGNLISGIESVVGFEFTDGKGLPVNSSGVLYEDDKVLLNFKAEHEGMGSFILKPKQGSTYHIKLSDVDRKFNYTFPEVLNKGSAIRYSYNIKDHMVLKLSQNENDNSKRVFLSFQIRGAVFKIVKTIIDKEKVIKVPLHDLPQGIVCITMFDDNFTPLAERLVYVNPFKKIYLKVEQNKREFVTKEKVKLSIKAVDENGNPIIAHLGIRVYDKLFQNISDPKTIETHYNLSDQLVDNIVNPSYYFDENNKNRLSAVNLLLLTHGWRRYVWNEKNLKDREVGGEMLCSENIDFRLYSNKLASNKNRFVSVFSGKDEKSMKLILVDSLNRLKITPEYLKFSEGSYLYLKPMVFGKEEIKLKQEDDIFEKNTIQSILEGSFYPIKTSKETDVETETESLQLPHFYNDVTELEEVVLTGKTKKKVFRDKYLGKLDSLVKVDVNSDYVCKSKYLNCPVHKNDSKNFKPVEGEKYMKYVGFQWHDNGKYSIKGIDHIVYEYPNFTEQELLDKFNLTIIKGLYGKREFYSPKYDASLTTEDTFPDYRNTLFWDDDVVTDENGEAEVEFFCSDINTTFIGELEGVGGDGLLGNVKFDFVVKKR